MSLFSLTFVPVSEILGLACMVYPSNGIKLSTFLEKKKKIGDGADVVQCLFKNRKFSWCPETCMILSAIVEHN